MCCSVLQCVAVCCSVLPRVAVSCDMVETAEAAVALVDCMSKGEVGGWGRDPKKCTGRDWGMGSSTI